MDHQPLFDTLLSRHNHVCPRQVVAICILPLSSAPQSLPRQVQEAL